MTLHLIPDWKQAWKYSSVRIAAAGAAVQGALLAFPMQLQQYLPAWVLSTLSVFALGCLILAIAGRITTTEAPSV